MKIRLNIFKIRIKICQLNTQEQDSIDVDIAGSIYDKIF